MTQYGIDTQWFSSYLSGHTQQVQIRTQNGQTITSGLKDNAPGMSIFQGGSLSCILYLLFSNDLGLFLDKNVTIVTYADDCQLLVSGRKEN